MKSQMQTIEQFEKLKEYSRPGWFLEFDAHVCTAVSQSLIFGASACFTTPLGFQTNLMVMPDGQSPQHERAPWGKRALREEGEVGAEEGVGQKEGDGQKEGEGGRQ